VFRSIADATLAFFEAILTFFHDVFVPVLGQHSWGWAIIALTLVVRVALLPLAIKQTRSMRAMQALQPQLKELQKKYKVDRDLMKKDPEQYKAKKQKLNEEMMKLYQQEGANPASSCLPLLAQAPIFIALFWTIRGMDELAGAPFYFFTAFIGEDASAQGLAALVSETFWPGWLLIVVMSGTMFFSMKQMQARTAATQPGDAPNPMAQQQKILLYVMPVFLAVISFNFPLGLLLYWCTTNIWQVAQQAIILREVKHEAETGELAEKPGGEAAARSKQKKGKKGKKGKADEGDTADTSGNGSSKPTGRISPGASSGKRPVEKTSPNGDHPEVPEPVDEPEEPTEAEASEPEPQPPVEPIDEDQPPASQPARRRDHLPRRGDARS
jgi:YidC/Oxa1 family membrane protein insertase